MNTLKSARVVASLLLSTCAVALPALPPDGVTSVTDSSWAAPSDADIRKILVDRIDTARQGVGIVVGIIDTHGRRIVSYGAFDQHDARLPDGDTIFEIGSATKVFTSLLLADEVQHGEMALDDPVAKYLPSTVSVPRRGDRQITLVDLATHTSGLPLVPDNLSPKDKANPYADYSVDQLYHFLNGYTLTRDIGSRYEYSNLAVGLLGHALSRRAGVDFEQLVRQRITEPLGMSSTGITLSAAMMERLAPGHDASLRPAKNWDIPTLAGAGALRSTAADLLKFLAAELGLASTPLQPAMRAQLAIRRPTGRPGLEVALGWHVQSAPGGEFMWHNGGTGGYRSFIAFDLHASRGVVVLSNVSTEAGVDDIGRHLLNGSPLAPSPRTHHATSLGAEILQGYVGQYRLSPQVAAHVTREGNRLFIQLTGQPRLEIFPETPTEFFLKAVDAQITFQSAHGGTADSLVLHQGGQDVTAGRVGAAKVE